MIDLGFTFEETPWEATLSNLHPGDKFSALRFLTLLEGEDEDVVEDAFDDLKAKHILLDVTTLPRYESSHAAATRLKEESQLVAEHRLKELPKHDPLVLYLRQVRRQEKITDCVDLLKKAKDGDNAAMDRLTGGRLFRTVELAEELTGYGVLLLDLMQEGNLGFCEAVSAWNGEDFAPFADWYIRSSMARYITLQARNGGIGQKMRKLMEGYRNADRKLLTKLGRNATLEEIALEMNVSPEDAAVAGKMLLNAKIAAKAMQGPKQDDPEEEDQPVENTAYFQSRQRVVDMLSTLPDEDARLLSMRFGLDGALPMTPEQTGEQLGITPHEVIEREAAALAKLRAQE